MENLQHKLFLFVCQFFLALLVAHSRHCLAENVKANFVFGDSLVDPGNNNYIVSLSKANYPPNGIDFGEPTGRFTNGRTLVDILGQEFGLSDFTPPYLDPRTIGKNILQGVNYASGAAGILNHTGKNLVGRINMDAQLDNFANTKQQLVSLVGDTATEKLLENALFTVTMGSNDFINNYLTPLVSTDEPIIITAESFIGAMISRYRTQLTRLYTLGARKIVVINVGPLGCIPSQRENSDADKDCNLLPNQLAQKFNFQLKTLTQELKTNLEISQFVYADVYHIFEDIIRNYPKYGFENADSSCCSLAGKYGGLIPCGPPSLVCEDRTKYVFWDPYHPTETVNIVIAARLLDGGSTDISPINLRQLAG